MGVKIINRQYKNQFYPATAQTDWLLGNVGDWQRLELDIEVTFDFLASTQESVQVDSVLNTFKLNNGKNWQDYGFDIGDDMILTYVESLDAENDGTFVDTPKTVNFKIVNIYGDTIEIDTNIDFTVTEVIPTDRGNYKIKSVKFETLKEPEGLKFQYSHIANENADTTTLKSFIDGTTTEFSFAGLNQLPNNIDRDMNPDGFQSGMAIDKAKIRKLGANSGQYEEVIRSVGASTFTLTTAIVSQFGNALLLAERSASSLNMIQQNFGNDFRSPGQHLIDINTDPSDDDYPDGVAGRVFLQNSSVTANKIFQVDFNFRVNTTNENSSNDFFALVLLKYENGNSMNFVSRQELRRWNDASSLQGQVLSFSELVSQNVVAGESYALVLEYNHDLSVNGSGFSIQNEQRRANVTVLNTSIASLVNSSGGNALAYKYRITADFMIASIFEDVSNLENVEIPQILFDAGSLTDNFNVIIYPEWNNPNTLIKNDLSHTKRLGSTGWFNENFNGLDNNFTIDSVRYFNDNGDEVESLDYSREITVEAQISGVKNLSANSEFGIGFAWIPQNDEDYKQKKTPFHNNLLVNTARKYAQGSFNLLENTGSTVYPGNSNTNSRMNITAFDNVMFRSGGADTVIMKAKFKPSAEFTLDFENKSVNDRQFLLWCSVADHNQQINFSDRVSLFLDYRSLIKTIDPAGPIESMKNVFIEHPQDSDVLGANKYIGFLEDDVLSRVKFSLDKKNDILGFIFGYEVTNKTTGFSYQLESYAVNTSNVPKDSNGIQQIAIDETRGFKLVAGNNKNIVSITRDEDNDVNDEVAYKMFFASKIRWESWIERSSVPTEFYDINKENNGYNNNWIDYLRSGLGDEYDVNFYVVTQVSDENDELLYYKNSFNVDFNAYDENLNIDSLHKYYKHSDNTDLTIGIDADTGKPIGALLNNEPTRIEITYTNNVEDFDINKLYAVISIEIDKGAGEFEYRQLSSVWLSEPDNPLIPLENETKLKVEQLSTNVIKTSCLVDPARLENVSRYKITGRIGCYPEGDTNNPSLGIYDENYENTYE